MTKVLILAIKTYGIGVVQKKNCFVDDCTKQRILKGGLMKRELMCHKNTPYLNILSGTHFGIVNDIEVAQNEVWEKIYGLFFNLSQ